MNDDDATDWGPVSAPPACKETKPGFFTKYFLQGQQLDTLYDKSTSRRGGNGADGADGDGGGDKGERPWYARHRKLVSVLLPLCVVWAVWWPYMAHHDLWRLFVDDDPATTGHVLYFPRPRCAYASSFFCMMF